MNYLTTACLAGAFILLGVLVVLVKEEIKIRKLNKNIQSLLDGYHED
jgi:hypothetical protein